CHADAVHAEGIRRPRNAEALAVVHHLQVDARARLFLVGAPLRPADRLVVLRRAVVGGDPERHAGVEPHQVEQEQEARIHLPRVADLGRREAAHAVPWRDHVPHRRSLMGKLRRDSRERSVLLHDFDSRKIRATIWMTGRSPFARFTFCTMDALSCIISAHSTTVVAGSPSVNSASFGSNAATASTPPAAGTKSRCSSMPRQPPRNAAPLTSSSGRTSARSSPASRSMSMSTTTATHSLAAPAPNRTATLAPIPPTTAPSFAAGGVVTAWTKALTASSNMRLASSRVIDRLVSEVSMRVLIVCLLRRAFSFRSRPARVPLPPGRAGRPPPSSARPASSGHARRSVAAPGSGRAGRPPA